MISCCAGKLGMEPDRMMAREKAECFYCETIQKMKLKGNAIGEARGTQ
jgi:hypothetical protein